VTPAPRIPPCPEVPLEYRGIRLRPFRDDDVPMVVDLSTDPYVPLVSTLPACVGQHGARKWLARQRRRRSEGAGYSFAIAAASTDRAVGQLGLWLARWEEGAGTVGYFVAPRDRGRGIAVRALRVVEDLAWSLPRLDRLELFVEPQNTASIRTAERARYRHDAVVRHPRRSGGPAVEMQRWIRPRPAPTW
jgi:[ribosomal protein S5]-alanine N-acetyltransferase